MPGAVSTNADGMSVEQLVELIVSEGAIGLTQAAQFVGSYRKGAPTSPTTLSRWAKHGVQLDDGRTLKLQAVRVAGRLVTSRARVIAFITAQNEVAIEG